MFPVELQLLLQKTMVVARCCSAVYFLFGGEIKKTAEICGLVGSQHFTMVNTSRGLKDARME
jgi:hypothetical protein